MIVTHEGPSTIASQFKRESQHPILKKVALMGGLMLADQLTTQLAFSTGHTNSLMGGESSFLSELVLNAGGGSAISANAFALTGVKIAAGGAAYGLFKTLGEGYKRDEEDAFARGAGKFVSGLSEVGYWGLGVIPSAFAAFNNLYHTAAYAGIGSINAPWDPAVNYLIYDYHIGDPLVNLAIAEMELADKIGPINTLLLNTGALTVAGVGLGILGHIVSKKIAGAHSTQ